MPAAHNKGRHDRLTGHAFCAATACCKLLLVPDVKLTHRTQLFLTDAQYRWLKVRAASAGSIAQVVRDWIDSEMSVDPVKLRDDPRDESRTDHRPGGIVNKDKIWRYRTERFEPIADRFLTRRTAKNRCWQLKPRDR